MSCRDDYIGLNSRAKLPLLQANWSNACPMLVAQFVVLDFVNDSHGQVFIVNPIVDTGFRRSSRIIHKDLILTGPDAFMLSD